LVISLLDVVTLTVSFTRFAYTTLFRSVTTLVKNVAPEITSLVVTPEVDEAGTVTLSGTFVDPGTQDFYTVVIDWGPGEVSETFRLEEHTSELQSRENHVCRHPRVTPQD